LLIIWFSRLVVRVVVRLKLVERVGARAVCGAQSTIRAAAAL
jgi:hypothetical protein